MLHWPLLIGMGSLQVCCGERMFSWQQAYGKSNDSQDTSQTYLFSINTQRTRTGSCCRVTYSVTSLVKESYSGRRTAWPWRRTRWTRRHNTVFLPTNLECVTVVECLRSVPRRRKAFIRRRRHDRQRRWRQVVVNGPGMIGQIVMARCRTTHNVSRRVPSVFIRCHRTVTRGICRQRRITCTSTHTHTHILPTYLNWCTDRIVVSFETFWQPIAKMSQGGTKMKPCGRDTGPF